MKAKLDVKSFFLGAACAAIIALTVAATNDKAVPLEYKVVLRHALSITDDMNAQQYHAAHLNQYATEGWETICSQVISDGRIEARLERIVLKRTKK